MATIATGVNTGRVNYGSLNFSFEKTSGDLRTTWEPRFEWVKDIVQNPYVAMSAGFIALCGAVAGLALAFTGSL